MTVSPATDLSPATQEDIEGALSFALRFNGRKRDHRADETMARIVAAHLAAHMRRCGFVVMKQPPGRMPSIVSAPGWKPGTPEGE